MLTGEIIQNILSLYEKGVPSDDSRLSPRQIFSRMITIRSKLLVQKSNKRQKISQWCYQTIPCLEMIKAQEYDCPCIPPIGCGIYKSKYPLPQPVTGINEHLLQSVTSLDGTTVYSETTWEEKKFKSGNKYTSKTPDYLLRNNHIILTTNKLFNKVIPVTGLFNNPIEVWEFENYCEKDCTDCDDCLSYLDREFPLDNDSVDSLIKLIIEELLGPFVQMKEDKTSNTADSSDNTSK